MITVVWKDDGRAACSGRPCDFINLTIAKLTYCEEAFSDI